MKLFEKEGDKFKITFRINDKYIWKNTLQKIKTLHIRYFDFEKKCWYCKATEENKQKLLNWGFEFVNNTKNQTIDRNNIKVPDIKIEGLRNYQNEAVKFLIKRNGIGLIADEMGLGKTISVIGYLKINPNLRPVLIVCPGSVKYNWQKEIKKWLNEETIVLSGRTVYEINKKYKFVVVNYAIVYYWKDYLKQFGFKYVVVDESHYISNHTTKRTKSVVSIIRNVGKFVALSGTPIKNKPKEFFTVLNLLDNQIFKSRFYFLNRYCGPKYNGFSWVYNGASNIDELSEIIKPYMIRREKQQVLKELPDKTREVIVLDGDLTEYNKEYEKLVEVLKNEKNKLKVKNLLDYLKSLTWLVKRNYVFQWIDDFLETGQKLVVFAIHRGVIFDLKKRYDKISVVIDGSVSAIKRQEAIDKFQNDKNIKLFIGNINSAGVGITLTTSNTVLFTELSWVPSDHLQAEDRVHRIGQKNSVFIYYLIAKDTIESKMIEKLFEKSKTVNQILSGTSDNIFDEIINFIK